MQNIFKKQTLVIALGLALFSSLSANAATTAIDLSSGSATFGNTLNSSGTFSDSYTFTIANGFEGDLSASADSEYLVGKIPFTNISFSVWGVDLTDLTLTGTTFAQGSQSTSTQSFLFGVVKKNSDTWTLSANNLAAGNYTINVSGKAGLVAGVLPIVIPPSSYSGTVSLVTSPIPEPETFGMMLAGLGLMGFVAARRKSV